MLLSKRYPNDWKEKTMRRIHAGVALVMILVTFSVHCAGSTNSGQKNRSSWQKEFDIARCTLVPTGRNQYFILEPGFQLILESRNEKLVITVLEETQPVIGIITRVVEEREWKNGQLKEVSRNFYAICERSRDVFYFGEEVDMYKNGKIVNHKGAWLAGENDAKPGLIMPGEPREGMKYYQELAPRKAMDRAEVVALNDTLETPAGSFSNCLKTKETTPLNILEREFKMYAPGVGLIKDAKLLLTKYGFVEKMGEGSAPVPKN